MFLFLLACNPAELSVDIQTTEDIRELCEANEPTDLELSVTFEALDQGCPWGEDDNLEPEQAVFTARIEQTEALELPEGGVICDLEFDFEGASGGEGQAMEYDDNFLLSLNDAVLAASYGPMPDWFEADEDLRLYDWDEVVGQELSFEDVGTWCLGEDQGSDCTIPPPETDGTLSLSFGGDQVDQLALRTVQEDRYDFSFVTFGDNDDTDCSHREFTFTVVAPVVTP